MARNAPGSGLLQLGSVRQTFSAAVTDSGGPDPDTPEAECQYLTIATGDYYCVVELHRAERVVPLRVAWKACGHAV